MKSIIWLLGTLFLSQSLVAETVMIYTAHRGTDSRIYLQWPSGETKVHQYSTSRLTDVEVMDHQVYIADAIAPRVYKLDMKTGDLAPVIDDWSLIVFYSVFSDGQYLYVEEANLRRYDKDGRFVSSATFEENARGMAWDGQWMWTLNDKAEMRAWDLSEWPIVKEKPELAFPAPTFHARGLFYDGKLFWTAESKDEEDGVILSFDKSGHVVDKMDEPISRGWGVGFVEI